jgi:outer membrane receptor protein involved in Fe transport
VQDGFVHRLALNGGFRHSASSLAGVGGAWSAFAGAELAPIPDIAFRSQYQRAIAFPRITQLFAEPIPSFGFAIDACSEFGALDTSDEVRQLCIATGVPAASVFTSDLEPFPFFGTLLGANPELAEEVADSWTVGVVVRPRFVPRLTIAADHYDIELKNVIDSTGSAFTTVDACYFGVRDAAHPVCRAISRDPATGTIVGVDLRLANIGARESRGVDLAINYEHPVDFSLTDSADTRLSLYALVNRNLTTDIIPIDGLRSSELLALVGLVEARPCAGRFGAFDCGDPQPKWSWITRLSWIDGPLTTSLRWRHVGAVRDEDDFTEFVVERIGAYDLIDLALSYDVDHGLTLTAGVNNLLGERPPIVGDNEQFDGGNTHPGTYDVLGRDFFISANVRF